MSFLQNIFQFFLFLFYNTYFVDFFSNAKKWFEFDVTNKDWRSKDRISGDQNYFLQTFSGDWNLCFSGDWKTFRSCDHTCGYFNLKVFLGFWSPEKRKFWSPEIRSHDQKLRKISNPLKPELIWLLLTRPLKITQMKWWL